VAWKGVHLTNPARLSLADAQLVVEQDTAVHVALEDIGWIIVDDPRITLTSALLSACMNAGIAIVITDARHTPSGLALPFHTHHRQAAVATLQLACTAPLKKRLWQSIVRAKIANQSNILVGLGREGAETVGSMVQRVGSGDPDNTEARAARVYWSSLFNDFTRSNEADRRNKMLNYGYAVVRSGVARALVAAGFLPCVGLHHASETNGFNLADDLVEPFRPFVDIAVFRICGADKNSSQDLTIEDRRAMAGILLAEAGIGEEVMTLLAATEQVAASLARAIEASDLKLLLTPRTLVSGSRKRAA
jgi:CRISP-associated protein Cas1